MSLGRGTQWRDIQRNWAREFANVSSIHRRSAPADDPWLAAIAAKKHKAFMDVMHFFPDGTPFRRAEAAALKAGAGTFAAAVLAQARGVGYVAQA